MEYQLYQNTFIYYRWFSFNGNCFLGSCLISYSKGIEPVVTDDIHVDL